MSRTGGGTFSRFLKRNIFFVLLMLVLLIGVLIGSIVFKGMNENTINQMNFLTQGFIKTRYESSYINIFIRSFSSSAILIILCFVLGFSAVAQPLEVLIPLFRGLGLGASISFVYCTYGIRGFFITLVLIVPYAVITSFVIIISTREAIRLSNIFTNYAFVLKGENVNTDVIKLYFTKYIVLLVINLIAAVIDCLFTALFVGVLFPS